LIQQTGGRRKVRWAVQGKGKSGGVREDSWVYVRDDVSYTTTRYDSFASTAPIPLLPYALANIHIGLN